MAVTKIIEQGQAETSELGKDSRTATRVFLVYFDAPASTVEAEAAKMEGEGGAKIPAKGDSHPKDAGRLVTGIRAEHHDSHLNVFRVEVQYSTDDQQDKPENPLNDPDQIVWGGAGEAQVAYFKDTDGKPVVNSAGEAFEHFLEKNVDELSATVTRNVAAYPLAQALAYANTVNSDPFILDGIAIGAGQAKLGLITASARQVRNKIAYVTITFPLKFRATWKDEIEDRGFNELVTEGEGANQKKYLKEIVKGTPPVKPERPWPLDGKGKALKDPTATPAVLTFKPYKEKPFAVFNFH